MNSFCSETMERYRAMPNGVTITTWMGTHYLRHCRRHRFPGNFFIICVSPFGNEKSPCSPKGTRTENTISAVPPCLPVKPTAHPAPTRRVPSNAGNASEDTQDSPFPSALGGPFAAPLFAPLSALGNSLWMRLQLYFRVFGFLFKLCLLNTKSVFLSSTFFHTRRTSFLN